MVDFSRLVLGPAMRTFGRSHAITYRPSAGVTHGGLRGVFDRAHVTVQMEDGAVHSTTEPRLGIRLAEWPAVPVQGAHVDIDVETFEIVDVQPDGQGGATLVLMKVSG